MPYNGNVKPGKRSKAFFYLFDLCYRALMFLPRIRSYWKAITIVILFAFALLFAFGFYQAPDKSWRAPVGSDQQEADPRPIK